MRSSSDVANAGDPGLLEHPALIYSNLREFLEFMSPFVVEAARTNSPAFIALGAEPLDALRREVGRGVASKVHWADTDVWHPNSSTRLRAFHEFVTQQVERGAERIFLAGEPVWSGPPEVVEEWQRYESILNKILEPFPVSLVCTYDSSHLSPEVAKFARVTHPVVVSDGEERPSAEFVEPVTLIGKWTVNLSPQPEAAARLGSTDDIASARRFLGKEASRSGLNPERTMDVLVAANEVLTNASVHGSGIREFAVWSDEANFYCEVQDAGAGIADPLAGYRPPSGDVVGGRGLWIARQLVDLMQIAVSARGTTVRLRVSK